MIKTAAISESKSSNPKVLHILEKRAVRRISTPALADGVRGREQQMKITMPLCPTYRSFYVRTQQIVFTGQSKDGTGVYTRRGVL